MKGRKEEKGVLPASMAALSRTAAGAPWPGVLLFAAGAAALRKLPRAQVQPRWLQVVQALWSAFLLNQALNWAAQSWRKVEDGMWIGLILLALAWWQARKGREAVRAISNVLGIFELGLLAAVLLASLREIQWANLLRRGEWPDGWLLAVMLLPGEGRKYGWLWALAFSLVTAGVGFCGENAFMEMSRSVSGFGSVRRLESLGATGVTIGLFRVAVALLSGENVQDCTWSALLTAGLFLSGFCLNGWAAALCAAMSWCILPALCRQKRTV